MEIVDLSLDLTTEEQALIHITTVQAMKIKWIGIRVLGLVFFPQVSIEKVIRRKGMELTDKQKAIIGAINHMGHYEMCNLWRNAPSGHPFFDKTQPFFEIFEERLFNHFGGFPPGISKSIGWK